LRPEDGNGRSAKDEKGAAKDTTQNEKEKANIISTLAARLCSVIKFYIIQIMRIKAAQKVVDSPLLDFHISALKSRTPFFKKRHKKYRLQPFCIIDINY
jgi:hypothetical protein